MATATLVTSTKIRIKLPRKLKAASGVEDEPHTLRCQHHATASRFSCLQGQDLWAAVEAFQKQGLAGMGGCSLLPAWHEPTPEALACHEEQQQQQLQEQQQEPQPQQSAPLSGSKRGAASNSESAGSWASKKRRLQAKPASSAGLARNLKLLEPEQQQQEGDAEAEPGQQDAMELDSSKEQTQEQQQQQQQQQARALPSAAPSPLQQQDADSKPSSSGQQGAKKVITLKQSSANQASRPSSAEASPSRSKQAQVRNSSHKDDQPEQQRPQAKGRAGAPQQQQQQQQQQARPSKKPPVVPHGKQRKQQQDAPVRQQQQQRQQEGHQRQQKAAEKAAALQLAAGQDPPPKAAELPPPSPMAAAAGAAAAGAGAAGAAAAAGGQLGQPAPEISAASRDTAAAAAAAVAASGSALRAVGHGSGEAAGPLTLLGLPSVPFTPAATALEEVTLEAPAAQVGPEEVEVDVAAVERTLEAVMEDARRLKKRADSRMNERNKQWDVYGLCLYALSSVRFMEYMDYLTTMWEVLFKRNAVGSLRHPHTVHIYFQTSQMCQMAQQWVSNANGPDVAKLVLRILLERLTTICSLKHLNTQHRALAEHVRRVKAAAEAAGASSGSHNHHHHHQQQQQQQHQRAAAAAAAARQQQQQQLSPAVAVAAAAKASSPYGQAGAAGNSGRGSAAAAGMPSACVKKGSPDHSMTSGQDSQTVVKLPAASPEQGRSSAHHHHHGAGGGLSTDVRSAEHALSQTLSSMLRVTEGIHQNVMRLQQFMETPEVMCNAAAKQAALEVAVLGMDGGMYSVQHVARHTRAAVAQIVKILKQKPS